MNLTDLKRGDIWTIRDEGYASKSRPAVIIQAAELNRYQSVILCLLTSYDSSDLPLRVPISPTPENGLRESSWVMTDKIVTVDRDLLGYRIGQLSDNDLWSLTDALGVILGLNAS